MSAADAPGGLIHALLLDGKGGASALPWREVLEWTPDRGCLWLLFNFEDAEAAAWLVNESGLNDVSVSALVSDETRPRCLTRGERLLLTLRGVNLTPGAAPEDMVSIRIWTDGHKVIGTRRRRLLSTLDIVSELEAGSGPADAAELLVDWIERIVDRMNETIEDYEDQVLALEDAILGGEQDGMRSKLAQLRKRTISIRRYLSPQREALDRLSRITDSLFGTQETVELREQLNRLTLGLEDLDLVRERALVAQEEFLGLLAHEQNARMLVLSIVAALFLPLSFLTGIYGMEWIQDIPQIGWLQFWGIAALCCAFVIFLMHRARML